MKNILYICLLQLCFTIASNAQNIVGGEYFFDVDLGVGKGTSFSVTPGVDINQTLTISTANLKSGFHNLFLRMKNENGTWSNYESRPIYIFDPVTAVNTPSIVAGEWFADTDPGVGKATAFALTTGSDVNQAISISTTDLKPGFHNVFIRVKNEYGIWSQYESRPIYIFDPVTALNAPKIVAGEWFADTDPGVGKATGFGVTASTDVNQAISISTSNLKPGFHNVFIRVKNENGVWSQYESRPVFIFDQSMLPNAGLKKIVSGEWFVDTDPGVGKATAFSLKADTNIVETIAMQLPALSVGDHQLFVRVKNEANVWSHYESRLFTVCPPPPAPIAKDTTICANSKAILTAKGTGIVSWFNQEKGGKAIATGDTLRLDTLKNTTTFYVQDSLCDISATRTAIKVTVIPLPVVKVLSSKITMCIGDTTVLSATGASTYVWSVLRDSTGRFVPKQTSTVSVKGLDAIGCAASDSIKLEVLMPSNSLTTKTACGSYDWNGKNYTQSGDYTFTTKNKIGCDSIATLKLTINQPSNSITTQIACGSFDWNGKNYTQSGEYTFASITKAGCDSVATLKLTINKPTTSTTTQTACGSYDWNGKNYTQSGDYTFTTKNKVGCDSVANLKLTINKPTTSTTTQTACGSYDWNGKNYTQSGDYTFTTKNKVGCDSIATLKLTIKVLPDVAVSLENKSILVKQANALYTWINCDNSSTKLDNNTEKTYTPKTDGNYAVIVDLDGCKDTSSCVKYGVNSIELRSISKINIYPNPSTGNFTISNAPIGTYTIVDELGKVVHQFDVKEAEDQKVQALQLSKGVYFLRGSNAHFVQEKIVVIE